MQQRSWKCGSATQSGNNVLFNFKSHNKRKTDVDVGGTTDKAIPVQRKGRRASGFLEILAVLRCYKFGVDRTLFTETFFSLKFNTTQVQRKTCIETASVRQAQFWTHLDQNHSVNISSQESNIFGRVHLGIPGKKEKHEIPWDKETKRHLRSKN